MLENLSIEYILLAGSILLVLSIVMSRVSSRFGIPVLVFFLAIGMLAGSDGPGGIYFDNAWAAKSLGIVALSLILFSGGLDTDWPSMRPVFRQGLMLSTFGVLLTALLTGIFAVLVLKWSWLQGFLLGSIVSSTDAAAVFAVLKSKHISLKKNLQPLLELESGSNDPMAVFLTLGLIDMIVTPAKSAWSLFPNFIIQMSIGALMGWAMSRIIILTVNRLNLEYEGLYPVMTTGLALLTYSLTGTLGGNGFLAVYLAGILVGRESFLFKKSLLRFHDGLAWLMQITMFVTLGLLVFPSQLPAVALPGLLISAFLILIARPASVFLSLCRTEMSVQEKRMVAWVGLRGAAPVILATFVLLAGIEGSDTIFHIVFFIVVTSVLVQGTTIPWVARLLGVDAPLSVKRRYPIEFEQVTSTNTELAELMVPYNSHVSGKAIFEIGFPMDARVTLVCRDEAFIVATGKTVLEGGDVLLVLGDQKSLKVIGGILAKTKT